MVHVPYFQNCGEYLIVFTIHIECRPSVLVTSETVAEDGAMLSHDSGLGNCTIPRNVAFNYLRTCMLLHFIWPARAFRWKKETL
jgi:hypothetical protein